MGATSRESVGRRRAPGELQAKSANAEGAHRGIETDKNTRNQIGQ